MQNVNFILTNFLLLIQKWIIKTNFCFAFFFKKVSFVDKKTLIKIIIFDRIDFLLLKLIIILEFILLKQRAAPISLLSYFLLIFSNISYL